MEKVEIRRSERLKIPFGKIVSKYAISIILSYYGPSDDVHDLMQRTSHLTRAYFINEDRLRCFLIKIKKKGIMSPLKKNLHSYAVEMFQHAQIDLQLIL